MGCRLIGKIKRFSLSGGRMNEQGATTVHIETTAESRASVPGWFGEITLIARHLSQQGVLAAINERVRFARRRFGVYEVIDFVAMLLGYASSGEATLEAYTQRVPCRTGQRSVGFWRPWMKRWWKRCVGCL
jgi:hypothetical protein